MSLAASGQVNHAVTQRGLEFLRKSQRADGSWPIDTNLATWCTTLAIDALPSSQLSTLNSQPLLDWLLNQQFKTEHPYTHAAPGGWAWTDLPGGVPDADDTAGALLALAKFQISNPKFQNDARRAEIQRAAEAGIRWLLNLQNRDGGIPTFCRGWGALPFDRSSADITAHAIRAWLAWLDHVESDIRDETRVAIARAVQFLETSQRRNGEWVPLWFGNQFHSLEENPIYGTARVLRALQEFADAQIGSAKSGMVRGLPTTAFRQGIEWLISAQNTDGSWGHAGLETGSIEETTLALQTLANLVCPGPVVGDVNAIESAIARGAEWFLARVESGTWREPSPIGFYFAKLWYFDRLYPMIFTVGALRAVNEMDSLRKFK